MGGSDHYLNRSFKMKEGDVFTMKGLSQDTEAVENFYDARGHIDVARGGNLRAKRIPNTDTGTMDIQYAVDEGQKSFVEKIRSAATRRPRTRSSAASWPCLPAKPST
jgi:outer membrane protein assembly factor BamA